MDDALRALTSLWADGGVDASALQTRSDGTLVASERTALLSEDTVLATASGESEALALSPEQLELGEVLGSGGMGAVRLGTQASLRREVAVKTAHDAHDPRARSALLKEAWVGGALEHPNVVPVHTLAAHDRQPAVVMLRIEGRSFQAELEAPERSEQLERHVRTLIACCRAVAFAHSRGILHLDLKPDNVMLGEYGQVYVVDWGLAAGFGDARPAWLMDASEIEGIAGTPGYMAPELSAADAAAISPRTDVYLLGGMLHTVLTGRPLHQGQNIMQLLLAAFESKPEPIPEAPAELVAIVHRATHVNPEERHQSADALREALEGFLRHRLADRMATEAERLLYELRPLVERGLEDETARAGDVEVEPKLAECAQAIAQARRQWAAHPSLEALSERLLDRRAAHALAHDRPDAAAAVLERMSQPSPDRLRALERVRGRIAERRTHLRRLEAMGRELDLTLGSASRRRVFAALGGIFVAVSMVLGGLSKSGLHTVGYTELLVEGALLVATLLPFGWLKRETFFFNTANRRLYGGLILTALTVEVHWIACALLSVPVLTAVGITPLYYIYAFGTLALVLDRRLGYGALAMTLAAVATGLWPAWTFELVGVGAGLAVFTILAAWRQREK